MPPPFPGCGRETYPGCLGVLRVAETELLLRAQPDPLGKIVVATNGHTGRMSLFVVPGIQRSINCCPGGKPAVQKVPARCDLRQM